MLRWASENLLQLKPEEIGEHYGRYRLHVPEAERAMAKSLGRHKSWVCRRLALIERLGAKAREELHVGLLSPTAARQIVRLPQGNQAEVLDAARLKPEDSDVVYPPNRVREPQLHIADAYQL